MARSPSGESVLTRAVRIFSAFDPDNTTRTLTEISRRAAFPRATAGRMVDELVRHGLLSRDDRRRVRIGVRMWELAQRASPTLGLREAAMPFLEDVQAVTGHSTQLGVLDGDEVLFVERLSAPGAVVNVTNLAGRLPVHASSAGLVLLASASAEARQRILDGPLPAFTPHTITDAATLRGVLADVRRRGCAFCPGHLHPDATGIAVPVRDTTGWVIAALGVVVPNDEKAWSLTGLLQATALGISRAVPATSAEFVGDLPDPAMPDR